MTDEERGMLFVRQERLNKNINQMREELVAKGKLLTQFGGKLETNPSRIVFTNAPGALGHYPSELAREPAAERGQMQAALDLTAVAERIQDYRAAQFELKQIVLQLGPG